MPLEAWEAVRDLLQRGGSVLWFILATTFVMWTLILERFWYFRFNHPNDLAAVLVEWSSRSERRSWYANQVRRELISRVDLRLRRSLGKIRTLVALCPLLGLLGTVSGMIEVFGVMALTGSSNARAMAAGVSKATIPTMAGMVAALSGLAVSAWLEKHARDEVERTEDQLVVY